MCERTLLTLFFVYLYLSSFDAVRRKRRSANPESKDLPGVSRARTSAMAMPTTMKDICKTLVSTLAVPFCRAAIPVVVA
jgi:hypothetical protein